MSIGPAQREHKEYESNCNLFRLSLGLTINEVCALTGFSPGTYAALNNGMNSPIAHGVISPNAVKLSDALQADPVDLWPLYFCAITEAKGYTTDQVISSWHTGYEGYGDNPEEKEIYKEQIEVICGLIRGGFTERTKMILHDFYIDDSTLQEIGDTYKISKERARQIIEQATLSIKAKFRYWEKKQKEL